MSLLIFLKRFVLHCLWALAATVAVLLAMEFFIPGSVTPYVDPLPWAVVAFAGLAIDSMVRQAEQKPVMRIITGIALAILAAFIVGLVGGAHGKSGVILTMLVGLMVGVTAWFVMKSEKTE